MAQWGPLAVAYSGGVDSTLVIKAAYDAFGDRAVAVTSVSPTLPASQLCSAKKTAVEIGIRHLLVHSDELTIPGYAQNGPNRCYLCRNDLYGRIVQCAPSQTVMADGTHLDDLGDTRPGLVAARAWGVKHPLVETGLNKADVRAIVKALGLSVWDRPASACLSSRFLREIPITYAGLKQIEQAEDALHHLGFRHVRVRYDGQKASVEVPADDFARLSESGSAVILQVKRCGFSDVTLAKSQRSLSQ